MSSNTFIKGVVEEVFMSVRPNLAAGVTVVSATASAHDETTGQPDNTVLSSTIATVTDGAIVTVGCVGGVAGRRYRYDLLLTLSTGEIWREQMWMEVRP